MLTKIKTALRNWLGITALTNDVERLRANLLSQAERVTTKLAELDKLTAIDADIGVRGRCSVILSGVYKGRGYVTFYDMSPQEFEYLVEEYRHYRKQHIVRNIDRPPHFVGNFSLKD